MLNIDSRKRPPPRKVVVVVVDKRCTCGLRVDADHQPETCDLRDFVLGMAGSRAGAFGRDRGAIDAHGER